MAYSVTDCRKEKSGKSGRATKRKAELKDADTIDAKVTSSSVFNLLNINYLKMCFIFLNAITWKYYVNYRGTLLCDHENFVWHQCNIIAFLRECQISIIVMYDQH